MHTGSKKSGMEAAAVEEDALQQQVKQSARATLLAPSGGNVW